MHSSEFFPVSSFSQEMNLTFFQDNGKPAHLQWLLNALISLDGCKPFPSKALQACLLVTFLMISTSDGMKSNMMQLSERF